MKTQTNIIGIEHKSEVDLKETLTFSDFDLSYGTTFKIG